MNVFDVAAVLMTVAALCGYLNYRVLRLPATSGTLVVALASSLAIVVVDLLFPDVKLRPILARFLGEIDFNEALMHGMLCFLLFAGALGVDLDGVLEHKWTIAALATGGVVISAAMVGGLMWGAFQIVGADVPLPVCVMFGALISPTDPVAVLGLLKDLRAPRSLEAQIAGESLFNDGVGVVVFLATASIAGLSYGEEIGATLDAFNLIRFFVQQVAGGALLGLSVGYLAYRALKSIDHHPLELLITLALVMLVYTVSFWIHVSGPIAVVFAGLLIGGHGRRFAMSTATREHVDAFWSMTDEILNAVLFLLLGLQVISVAVGVQVAVASLLAVPIVLVARFVSVFLLASVRTRKHAALPGLAAILTWTGLRGGISVAMVLSLPTFPARDFLLAATYAIVVFSVVVQGLTVGRVLRHYGVAGEPT